MNDDSINDESIDPRSGSVLQERYRIIERLALGAMGVVYRAERIPIGRPVAVKFLHVSYASDRQFLQRFERETRVMSRLSHPNCVSVIDFGIDDAPYVVMDFVTGRTLQSLIEDGPLEMNRAVHITRQILAGLAHAHEQGVVHRDIKSANVMLSDAVGAGDHVRILDFGLAMLHGAPAGDISHSFVVIGTPNYMSPEQANALKVDARSDLYSVGVVLFELLTARKPFTAATTFEVLRMHKEEPLPRLTAFCPELPGAAALQRVLERAMANDPDDRFASAIEFSAALEAVVAEVAEDSAIRALPPRRNSLALVGGLLLLLLGGGGVWAWKQASFSAEDPDYTTNESARPPRERPRVAGAATPSPRATAPATAGVTAPVPATDAAAVTDVAALPDGGGAMDAATPGSDGAEEKSDATAEDAASADQDGGADNPDALPEEERQEPVAAVPESSNELDSSEPPTAAAARQALAPAATRPAPTTLQGSIALIRAGKSEQAIAALEQLRTRMPRSAYIPYLLGNLYFEKRWWSAGMEQYQAAIRRNRVYRAKPILIQNVIRALGSPKTRVRATALILRQIGKPALPHLRRAARLDPHPEVRRQAANLVKRMRR
jgi:serine/threonine-protein kinase